MAKKQQEELTVAEDEQRSAESRGVAMEPGKTQALAQYDESDLGAGFEDFGKDDMMVPLLTLLQKGSPQVEEDNAAHIEGAKAGMLLNSVTGELYDGKVGIRVVPVHREHKYFEWKDRDEGGGLLGIHNPEDEYVLKAKANGPKFGKIETSEGALSETFSVVAILIKGEGDDLTQLDHEPVVLSFASTQIKEYKRWMMKAMSCVTRGANGERKTLPMFAHVYRMRTVLQSNAKGTWYGWQIGFDAKSADACRLPQDHPLYQAAKALREMVTSGQATINRDGAAADPVMTDDTKF